jgi:hypothetical protein
MARRTINRMEKRAEYEAYEANQRGKSEDDEELEDDEDAEPENDDESQAGDEDGEQTDDEEAPPPKKKKPAKEPKPRSRARAVKVPRLKVIWGVFNNANQCVARYEYPRKHEATEHAARLQAEKKQTFFVQPVKEPIEDKQQA